MTLSVIGAGFGRTGTESIKIALEALGFGPCHHMTEIEPDSEQSRFWRDAVTNESPDWDLGFSGYNATVDWPSAYWWRELSEHYPEAKILLTVRSSESWYASFSQTIQPLILRNTDPDSLGRTLIQQRVFGNRIDDRDYVTRIYKDNIREVEASIAPERLLTYQLGSGWAPLCEFLQVPVPDIPFPRSNNTDDFNDRNDDSDPGRRR